MNVHELQQIGNALSDLGGYRRMPNISFEEETAQAIDLLPHDGGEIRYSEYITSLHANGLHRAASAGYSHLRVNGASFRVEVNPNGKELYIRKGGE